jgi:hypothetical protein
VLLLVAVPAVGLVALAGVGAGAMLQPRTRAVVAGVLVLVSLAVVWLALARGDALLGAGAVVLALATGAAALRSTRWPPPGRGRTAPRTMPTDRDTWEALDRGEDPTA